MLALGALRPTPQNFGGHGAHSALPREQGPGWAPPIVRTVATRHLGVPELAAALDRHREHATKSGEERERRRRRYELLLKTMSYERWLARFSRGLDGEVARLLDRIGAGELDPYSALDELLHRYQSTEST